MRFPKNRISLIVFITLVVFFSKAQQFNFPREENYSFPRGFDERFEKTAYTGISIKSLEPFRLNKVKEVRLYNSRDQLITFFELDKTGNVRSKGVMGKYYFATSHKEYTQSDTIQSDAWYLGPMMVRADTTHVWRRSYQNADTLMEYLEYELSVYKTGAVVNERNGLFSGLYLRPSEKYRADYDSSRLYLCRYENYGRDFWLP